MDQILASLQPVRESILRFLGLEETVSEAWLWAALGCCLFLLFYLPIWFLVRKRRTSGHIPRDPPSLGEAEGESVSAAEPLSTKPVRAPQTETGPEQPPAPAAEEAPESLLERLRGRLAKTQDQLIGRLDQIFLRSGAAERDLLEDLEEVLVTADLGVKTSYDLLGRFRRNLATSL